MVVVFHPLPPFTGGLIISYATSSLLAGYGTTLGVSGIAHSVLSDPLQRNISHKKGKIGLWKPALFAGILVGGLVLRAVANDLTQFSGGPVFDAVVNGVPLWRTLLTGFLVGIGTKIGSGCTSGHMLMGVARLSKRSIVATATFFSIAVITAQLFPAPLPPAPPPAAAAPSLSRLSLATLLALQLPALFYTLVPPFLPQFWAEPLASFFIGVHFTFGLALAGMTRPTKVLSFFYLPVPSLPLYRVREWDPSLAMVALGGLLPNILVWQCIKRWRKPLWKNAWELPTRKEVDAKLVLGSALFGVGWGLSGLCPGPALTVLGSGIQPTLLPFFAAFISGGVLGGFL
ncbi:hypothetical protein T439DRAFT_384139 [Meredithblackwellia eburnea MCA 4105]